MIKWLFVASLALGIGCRVNQTSYALDLPSETLRLNEELNEISGLQWLNDSTLVGVQDENGILYFINSNSGAIEDTLQFGKDGDYEGVTRYKEDYYVLKSNGNLVRIRPGKKTKKYDFEGGKHFDFEGICTDEDESRLLVACKEHGEKKKRDEFYVYSFSLEDKRYKKSPVMTLSNDLIHKNFKASGIAFHPNGSLYVVSSFSKTLAVLNRKGELQERAQLDPYIFHQPEGITFGPNGTLFISNEKKETTATILKFYADHEENK